MTKHYSILMPGLFLLIGADIILAQTSPGNSYHEWNPQNKTWPGVEKLDSSIIETWDTITGKYIISRKDEYAYADYMREILHISYTRDTTGNKWIPGQKRETSYVTAMPSQEINSEWDANSNQWIYHTKREYKYTGNYLMTSNLEYGWNKSNSQWTFAKKEETTFNSANKPTSDSRYHWDTNESQWIGESKSENYYDSNMQDTLQIYFNWDSTLNQFIGEKKYRNYYDENGKDSLQIIYNWNASIAEWVAFYKFEHTYETNPAKSVVNSYQWDNEWLFKARYENIYDDANRSILYFNYIWNKTTQQWDGSSQKTEYTYDAQGNITMLMDYRWDVAASQWVAEMRQESTFGENGRFISYSMHIWNEIRSQWEGISKIETTSDEFGYPVIEMTYQWNTGENDWANALNKTNYYSEFIPSVVPGISDKRILVYPNPANEFVVFDLKNTSGKVTVEFFDIEGKKVQEQELSGTMQISVLNLTKGLHMYRLNVNGNIYKGKLLIE